MIAILSIAERVRADKRGQIDWEQGMVGLRDSKAGTKTLDLSPPALRVLHMRKRIESQYLKTKNVDEISSRCTFFPVRFPAGAHCLSCGLNRHARTMSLCLLHQAGDLLVHRPSAVSNDLFGHAPLSPLP